MNIYHVDYTATDANGTHTGTVGVCAATKTEAAQHAHTRLRGDGWGTVNVTRTERVARTKTGDTWEPGTVLVYA